MLGGVLTAVLYTRCHINGLLAGILVIPSLYSVTYRLMGERPIDLPPDVRLEGGLADPRDIAVLALLVLAVAALLAWFFRTALGVAMRATGDNPGLVRGCGVEDFELRIESRLHGVAAQ